MIRNGFKAGLIVSVGFLVTLICAFFLFGCLSNDNPKEFRASNDVNITLTEEFTQSGSFDEGTSGFTTGINFDSKTAKVQIFKWELDDLSSFVEMNLSEFAHTATDNDVHYDSDNKLCYSSEYPTSNGNFRKSYFFKSTSAYFQVVFTYVTSGDERISTWAKSISLTGEQVFDIDESITSTKKITLNKVDLATMNIGTSFIKTKNSISNIYKKLDFSGKSYTSICEINSTPKSVSVCATIEEFAESHKIVEDTKVIVKDKYITQISNSYLMEANRAKCTEYAYFLESTDYFYQISFITTNDNEKIELFNSYVDTFSFE